MKLTNISLKNWQFTVSVVFLILITGILSFIQMPRSEDPQLDFPGDNIAVIYPGASPADMEELIINHLEDAVNELEDIKEIRSTIEEGIGIIDIEFNPGSDSDDKYREVLAAVESVRPNLPNDIPYLNVMKYSSTQVKIMQIALVSHTASYPKLEKYAKKLKDILRKQNGINKVEIHAVPDRKVHIRLEREKMEQYNILPNQVAEIIKSTGTNIPGGFVSEGARRFSVKSSGAYSSLNDIRKTVIRAQNGGIIHLEDISTVKLAIPDTTHRARYNGAPAIFLTLEQKKNTNILSVVENVNSNIKTFSDKLPEDISLHTMFDQSEGVRNRLNGFFITLLQGFCLVALVIFLFLGARASIIVVTVIPVSVFGSIMLLDLTGQGLNQISIIGFVIALGLFVDNAIVVVENIIQFRKNGYSPKDAAIQGTSQITWAIISSTATTVLAFVPMLILNTDTGDFIRSLPLTVVYSLLASLLMSLTFTPFLGSKFLTKAITKDSDIAPLAHRTLETIADKYYKPILQTIIKRPAITSLWALMFVIVGFSLFGKVGVSLFPKAEKPMILIDIEMPEGSSIAKTDSTTKIVENILDNTPKVLRYATNVGRPNPRVYYNMFSRRESPSMAQILVHFKKYNRKEINSLVSYFRKVTKEIPGAEIEISEFLQGSPLDAPIAFRLLGENLDSLTKGAFIIEEIVRNTDGIVNVNNSSGNKRTDVKIDFNRDQAALYGVTSQALDFAIRGATTGYELGEYRDNNGNSYDILLQMSPKLNPDISDLERISVPSLNGRMVPLRQIATLQLAQGPNSISHYNLERLALITADVDQGKVVETVNSKIIEKLQSTKLPWGVVLNIAGEKESRDDSFGGMGIALIAAAITILAILILQFRSFLQPFIVFTAVPGAIVGSILALLVTGQTFSFTAFIGLTGLIGIVVNNSIILLDYANQMRAIGKSVNEAISESALSRLTPIVLTTLTTIGGLIPLALTGSSLWTPLAVVIIGGLVVSTFMVLIIVPALYVLVTKD